jgi:hypothetical protein
VRRPLALASAALAALGLYGAVTSRRRRPSPAPPPPPSGPDPRAEELRRKLAESRSIVEEREEFESAETPVDRAEPVPEVDERRRQVHARGRSAAQKMRETGAE